MKSVRRRLGQALPPLVRRDERIRTLSAQRRELQEQLRQSQSTVVRRRELDEYLSLPSFRRELVTLRRTTSYLRDLDPHSRHPIRKLLFKLRNYQLAASHGIAVPDVHAAWMRPEDIDLEELPEAFVVKSDGGAASRGVLPLRRRDDDRFETIDAKILSAEDVRRQFQDLKDRKKVNHPYFAEELLVQPGGMAVPDDVKIYSFYGEVHEVILIRRATDQGLGGEQTHRYLSADATDLGDVMEDHPSDTSIQIPPSFSEMMEAASHLSKAVGVPFVRVDLFQTDRGVVFGELTRAPGGPQYRTDDHDREMGAAWERAAYRLDMDLIAGRPAGQLHGAHPIPELYPAAHFSHRPTARSWQPHVVPCERWCGPT